MQLSSPHFLPSDEKHPRFVAYGHGKAFTAKSEAPDDGVSVFISSSERLTRTVESAYPRSQRCRTRREIRNQNQQTDPFTWSKQCSFMRFRERGDSLSDQTEWRTASSSSIRLGRENLRIRDATLLRSISGARFPKIFPNLDVVVFESAFLVSNVGYESAAADSTIFLRSCEDFTLET